jgi:hypothetical protein
MVFPLFKRLSGRADSIARSFTTDVWLKVLKAQENQINTWNIIVGSFSAMLNENSKTASTGR